MNEQLANDIEKILEPQLVEMRQKRQGEPAELRAAKIVELKAMIPDLTEALDRAADEIRTLRAEGKTVDEIVALAPNAADYDKTWATSFINPERYVRMIVNLLERE